MFIKIQLIKILKNPIPNQANIGKSRGGFLIFSFLEIKKLAIHANPKITIKTSSTLISIILPPSIIPAEKLGEKAIAIAKKINGKFLLQFLLIIIKIFATSV